LAHRSLLPDLCEVSSQVPESAIDLPVPVRRRGMQSTLNWFRSGLRVPGVSPWHPVVDDRLPGSLCGCRAQTTTRSLIPRAAPAYPCGGHFTVGSRSLRTLLSPWTDDETGADSES